MQKQRIGKKKKKKKIKKKERAKKPKTKQKKKRAKQKKNGNNKKLKKQIQDRGTRNLADNKEEPCQRVIKMYQYQVYAHKIRIAKQKKSWKDRERMANRVDRVELNEKKSQQQKGGRENKTSY
eukprot:TRINITY_DN460_c0_g1_i22.p3 TRINITY_DN460_c0_g1~~TRINITY_DN460_c0_g1_i22.p3  ORF type:complete len:123 (+),score=33.23 TRINITY_DN460_c0_g1_i22:699-1067(+)